MKNTEKYGRTSQAPSQAPLLSVTIPANPDRIRLRHCINDLIKLKQSLFAMRATIMEKEKTIDSQITRLSNLL